jgi:hypothetical protein
VRKGDIAPDAVTAKALAKGAVTAPTVRRDRPQPSIWPPVTDPAANLAPVIVPFLI